MDPTIQAAIGGALVGGIFTLVVFALGGWREDRHRFTTSKRELYGSFAEALDAAMMSLLGLRDANAGPAQEEAVQTALKRIDHLVEEIILVGQEPTVEAAREGRSAAIQTLTAIRRFKSAYGYGPSEELTKATDWLHKSDERLERVPRVFTERAREDLGVDPVPLSRRARALGRYLRRLSS
jgi:hypothetical protein